MKIIKVNKNNYQEAINQACEVLRAGGLVVYPTETCYGLGADVKNQKAIDKLLSYKSRREGKPLSVLVSNEKQAEEYVDLNGSAKRFYSRFLPGPMTVISKSKGKVDFGVESELRTLGIRISSHKLAMDLAKAYRKGITATSANASYKRKPYSINDLLEPLSEKQKGKLDLILDFGKLPKRESSTVVDTTLLSSMVLRKGDIDLGNKKFEMISNSEEETMKLAQTLILKHWNNMRENGIFVGLIGDLGVGKTIFAKGVGKFLKILETITSPSYSLCNEYEWEKNKVKGKLFHLDPWRLENFNDFMKLGIEEMVSANNIILVEWMSKYIEEIEKFCEKKQIKFVKIYISDQGENKRKIEVFD